MRRLPGSEEPLATMVTKEKAEDAFSDVKPLKTDDDAPPASGAGPDPGVDEPKGHPNGLYTLFGAEAWERFSYYGMRALLVLYLVNKMGYDRAHALEVYGLYT